MTRKSTITHQKKLEIMRTCHIFRKSVDETIEYFQKRGYSISARTCARLKAELLAENYAEMWFSRDALEEIEKDHMLSWATIKMMEDRLVKEFEQVSSTPFYDYINEGTDKQKLVRNKSHDSDLMIRLVAQFESLQNTKTKMASATPLVAEVMEIHRRQTRENENMHDAPKEMIQPAAH